MAKNIALVPINNGVKNGLWNTEFSELVLYGDGSVQNIQLGSPDSAINGTANNFNRGALRLESSISISMNLIDNAGSGAAVREHTGFYQRAGPAAEYRKRDPDRL